MKKISFKIDRIMMKEMIQIYFKKMILNKDIYVKDNLIIKNNLNILEILY